MKPVINFKDKLTLFSEYWTPKVVAQFDSYHIKMAKMKGEFVWHSHADEDEVFIVVSGSLKIMLRDGEVIVAPGECFVVPKGVEHKPVAEEEVAVILIERAGTVNTGDAGGDKTVHNLDWI